MSNESELNKKIQESILNVFKEFQRVCKILNLTYFAIGGTCIGAVRHKGFIPWDDDLDVAMPYPDYKRFIENSNDILQEPYSVFGPHLCRHYSSTYIKLQNHNTTFIEQLAFKYPDRYAGVYIDIFPIYGLPKSKIKAKFLERRCALQNKLNYYMRYEIDDFNTLKSRIIWRCCSLLRYFRQYNYYCEKQEKMFSRYDYNASEKIIFCWRAIPKKNSNLPYKNIFFYDDFSEMVEVPFVDTTIMIPKGYDRYLRMEFGDYMKLPPKKEQVSNHPKAIIDLNKSYLCYLNEIKRTN